jgi:hypothetical protein
MSATIQNNRNYCSTCKKQLSTGSAYSNHIKSKKHTLKLLESQSLKETEQRLGNSNYINANITNHFDTINLRCDDGEYNNKEYDNEESDNEESDNEESDNEKVKYFFTLFFLF